MRCPTDGSVFTDPLDPGDADQDADDDGLSNRSEATRQTNPHLEDTDADGSLTGEPPLAGITIYIDLNDNGMYDAGAATAPSEVGPIVAAEGSGEPIAITAPGRLAMLGAMLDGRRTPGGPASRPRRFSSNSPRQLFSHKPVPGGISPEP